MKLLRMKPGHGEIVLAEGDVEVPEQERERDGRTDPGRRADSVRAA